MTALPPLHVKVDFGKDVPYDIQGPALLEFERSLRRLSVQNGGPMLWIEVFKDIKGDDSKLRVMMTKEERAKL